MNRLADKLFVFAVLAAFVVTVPFARAGKESDPFKVTISAGAEWTDNRDSSPDEEENTALYISPRLDIVASTDRAMFDFFYAPSFTHRTDPGPSQDDDDWYHDLGLNTSLKLADRLRLMLSDSFSRTLDPAYEDQGTTLRRDSDYYINRVNGGLDCDIAPQSVMTVRARHMVKAYDDGDVADQYDQDSIGATVGFWRQVQRTMGLEIMADYAEHHYNDGDFDVDRDSSSVYGAIGLNKNFSQHFSGMARVGYKQFDYKDDAIDSEGAPFVRVAVKGAPNPGTRLTLGVSHELKNADEYPFASEQFTGVDARLEWDAMKNLLLAASGSYWLGRYEDSVVPTEYPNQVLSDPTWAAYLAANDVREDGDKATVMAALEAKILLPMDSAVRIVQRYENVESDVSQDFTRNSTSLIFSKEF